MNEQIKINKLEIENVKRVKAVVIEPTAEGLTVIGGKNSQGKTSVLDAIAWALGGNKFKPSKAEREGSTIPPHLRLELSNGLIVERKGKNSDLKVTDPQGNKGGQQLLDSFVEQLALNLPKFMEATNKEKADTLLQIIGVGDKLYELEMQEEKIYNERHAIGQIADQKKKFAEELPFDPTAPKEPVAASELIQKQQEILARNGENQRKRQNVEYLRSNHVSLLSQKEQLEKQLAELNEKVNASTIDLATAEKSALDLHDESTEELEKNIQEVEAINVKVRANLDKEKAEGEAIEYKEKYDALTEQIEEVRKQKADLLQGADLPLQGLMVENGVLIYNGQQWDNMSSSEQLRVATAIVRKLKPQCGFVLLDKLEMMDIDTLNEFGKWLEGEGLQAIATRVSTGEECSIIIEDGYAVDAIPLATKAPVEQPTWKAGEF
ncbi:chromosome segregation protein SMC [Erysipelotrichaceae bacterium MTC7]|nr:chromosome segregation protein SMC [Erysipelotrichaceae bacterium MTC7]